MNHQWSLINQKVIKKSLSSRHGHVYLLYSAHPRIRTHAQIYTPATWFELNDTWLMRHCISDCPEVWQRCSVIYDAPHRPHSTDLVYVLLRIYNMAIKNIERQGRGGKEKPRQSCQTLHRSRQVDVVVVPWNTTKRYGYNNGSTSLPL